jgi:CBS domain-containing protein
MTKIPNHQLGPTGHEALKIMEDKAITSLAVVDNETVVGFCIA